MRIPYIINKDTVTEYTPSKETLELLGEANRKIRPEDYDWDSDLCPSLVTFCVRAICDNFKDFPLLELPCPDRNHLLEILPLDLPLELVVPLIEDEIYWQRRYTEHFGMPMLRRHPGWTWKCMYLEKHMQQIIEQAQPQYADEEDLDEITTLINPYVHRLLITQLQPWKPPLTWSKEDIPETYPNDHINFEPILKKLENVEELDIVFGVKGVVDNFSWQMFKVSVDDCRNLGRAVLRLKGLNVLKLHRSKLEDQHIQALANGLVKNKTLKELHLSHCQIGDHGALCIAKLISVHSTIEVLNLCNNKIGGQGGEGLGYALLAETCCPLKKLDLRLNPLEHQGSMGIMRAIVRCDKPRELVLSGCGFTDETSLRVGQMLKINTSLKILDVSNNWFGDEGGESLVDGLLVNQSVEWMDVRETDISEEQYLQVQKYLRRNRVGLNEENDEPSEEILLESAAAEEKIEDNVEKPMDQTSAETTVENI